MQRRIALRVHSPVGSRVVVKTEKQALICEGADIVCRELSESPGFVFFLAEEGIRIVRELRWTSINICLRRQ